MRCILEAGADKIAINTAAVLNSELVREGANKFGSQCIVVAIDAKRLEGHQKTRGKSCLALDQSSKWEVYTYGGRKPTGIDALKWAEEVVMLGAGEIMLTSMDADGQQTGYDLELTRTISEAVNVPIIASGGAGNPAHLHQAITIGKADAVLAASIFHYDIYSIHQTKIYLAEKGIPVRL
jgi:cyclase